MGDRSKKELAPPSCPDDEEPEGHYQPELSNEHIVMKYTGLNILQIMELSVFDYWYCLRDAAIYYSSKTDEGRDWLEECWARNQTEPDRKALRETLGKQKS